MDGANVEFFVLGPLEARIGERALALGGGKQRAVLALLLLRAGELVTIKDLVDGVWGEEPPPSAAHTSEVYVSRLRRLLEPHGATIARRGDGYLLDLGGRVDARDAERLAAEAGVAAGEHRNEDASRLAAEALSLWRGQVLGDVPLHDYSRAEVGRLEELRLRLIEIWAEAQLTLGEHEEVAAELRPLIAPNPYRERLVGQLMIALYRCDRQAEALGEYERLRQALDDDLGLLPGAELRRLSAQIVRQDDRLRLPAIPPDTPSPVKEAGSPRRRAYVVVAAVVLATASAALAVLVSRSTDGPSPGLVTRIALVVPQDPAAEPQDAVLTSIVDGIHRAEREYGVTAETLVADEFDRDAPSVHRLLVRLHSGSFGLVLVFGGLSEVVSPVARKSTSARYVFFDRGPKLPNATVYGFADRDAGYLAGYLSGLVEASRSPRLNDQHVVSMIGGMRGADTVDALLQGFAEGVKKADPDTTILRDYSQEFADTSPCEKLANRQIDAGADIVFAAAGRCSLGAVSAAAIRRVWAVGVDADQSYLGDHVLVSTVKRYDQAVFYAIRSYVQKTLRSGLVHLGLRAEAVGIVGISPPVADSIRRKVAQAARDMKSRDRE